MKHLALFVLVSGLVLSLSLPCQAKDRIKIYTNNYEPYYGKKLPDYGPVLKVITLAFADAGYDTDIRFMPWARVINEGKHGACDAIAGVWFNTGREDWMALSDSIIDNEVGFFKRASDDLVFTNFADLKAQNVVVGVVRDYINPKEFSASGILTDEVGKDILNLRKLVGNRVRLTISDKNLGFYLMKAEGKASEIAWLTTLQRIPLRLGIMKKAPGDWQKIMADFNKSLEALRNKGIVAQIFKEYDLEF